MGGEGEDAGVLSAVVLTSFSLPAPSALFSLASQEGFFCHQKSGGRIKSRPEFSRKGSVPELTDDAVLVLASEGLSWLERNVVTERCKWLCIQILLHNLQKSY